MSALYIVAAMAPISLSERAGSTHCLSPISAGFFFGGRASVILFHSHASRHSPGMHFMPRMIIIKAEGTVTGHNQIKGVFAMMGVWAGTRSGWRAWQK